MTTAKGAHEPVLVERVVALLAPALEAEGSVLVDATLGLAGHAEAILDSCPRARLIGLDRDPAALERSHLRLQAVAERVSLVHAVYSDLPTVLDRMHLKHVQGILFDLGVSSMQLDDSARGFAYARDAPLDMRMDPSSGLSAADVLNTYDEAALARVLRDYGEERFAARIARAVVRARAQQPFVSSARLVELVRDAIPAATRRRGGHPAKRTFQALRIEVNAELDALEAALPAALSALAVGGRLVVLAYHSLEDRIVKRLLAAASTSSTPIGVPVELPQHRPQFRLIVRGAESPSEAEIAGNPRAASARLRAVERVRPAA